MFRRYPYWGWLALSVLLWCINGWHFSTHQEAVLPARMAEAVNSDLQHRHAALMSFAGDEQTIRNMMTDSLTERQQQRINGLPFYVYAYSHDTLKSWNTNTLIVPPADWTPGRPRIVRYDKGVFAELCIRLPFTRKHQKLMVLYPILINYPLENDYLKSHFAALDYIPVKTLILDQSSVMDGSYAITINGEVVFYLKFNQQDIQKWVPDAMFISMLLAALLATISWVHLIIIYFTRKKSSLFGLAVTLTLVITLRSLLYIYGLPFNLDTLLFFSPRLYASSKYLSSFGDLFINTLCLLWLVVFMTRHTPYKTYFLGIRSGALRYPPAIMLTLLMVGYVYLFVNVIRSLVLDSSISFDVSHFYTVNVYTILGLLVITAIAGISCLVIYLFNVQLYTLVPHKWTRYLLVAITGLLLIVFASHTTGGSGPFDWVLYSLLLCWLLLFLILLDIRNFTLVSDLFEPHMIFWAVFICLFCTFILQYFNQARERDTRKAFVERTLVPTPDNVLEIGFDKVAEQLEDDKVIKDFLQKPGAGARKQLDKYLDATYLTGQEMGKYEAIVYLFDAGHYGLYNKDTTDYYSLNDDVKEASATYSRYLSFKQSILGRQYYLSYIPIPSATDNRDLGVLVIALELKKQVSKTVYPELLQPFINKANVEDNEYAYAVYINDKLISQTNDYPFNTTLTYDTLREQQSAFYKNNNVWELHYRIADKRTVVVIHFHSEALETVTLFSYLFGIQVLLAIVVLIYQLYLSYFFNSGATRKVFRLTLRRRVHFSMLAVVLVSFVIIGFVTILFFRRQYLDANSDKLQSVLHVAKQSVQDYLKKEDAFISDFMFDTVTHSPRFKDFITATGASQEVDINIFDYRGVMFATSRDEIYDKGLLARIMRPDAYYYLNTVGLSPGRSLVIQNEEVGELSYRSAYQPLRDEQGITLGYINVPFFSSEKDLNFQISNIVVTLINLYAFIFLLSSLFTVFITRWITGTFSVIIEQFGRINLKRNERIVWPYDDEIGLLVGEYNKMVNKVEENAAMLAQSERESAWREMARQVAHEIKNPLTPMKLNIQYLQQAMRNDHPGIKALTEKVSVSIIEQIDNLSYIASEFSNFAKMPEARPEEIDLKELVASAAELYINEPGIKVTMTLTESTIIVLADKSQMLRVCTNLLQNATQAIPEGRAGTIDISLSTDGYKALLAIADNGTGIDEEVASRIFQPYFTTKSSGTGLGLAMTRKIIEFWKGQIWFETKADEGTVFFIQLPLSATGEGGAA